jgi:hypothetical protein
MIPGHHQVLTTIAGCTLPRADGMVSLVPAQLSQGHLVFGHEVAQQEENE